MTATVPTDRFPDRDSGWVLDVNGARQPANAFWEVTSRFGRVSAALVLNPDGSPGFDRPMYEEAPNVNIIAFGRNARGAARVAVIRQPRPHADEPDNRYVDGHLPVVFGQVPMGFIEKLIGESPEEAARRETGEETGATAVIRVFQPACPWHNPNPTFVRTWSDLYFVEVDLERVEALRPSRDEPIYSAEYVPVPELLRRIRDGRDEQGALYRMCTANSVLFIFFATFPELFEA